MSSLQFDESLIRIIDGEDRDAYSIEEELAGILTEHGLVKSSFALALHKREQNFPTGLEVPNGISVAVPHCDPEHVERGAMCIGILKQPVSWRRMDAPDATCPVRLVVMLALDEAHGHLEMLQKVISLALDQELMKRMVACDEAANAYELVKGALA